MIIIDDWRVAAILGVVAAVLLVILAWTASPQPQCPEGSTAKYIKSSWYCIVEPVK